MVEGVQRDATKVGSGKSPGRIDLLQTSAGGILYPTQCKGCPSSCRSIFNHKFNKYDLD